MEYLVLSRSMARGNVWEVKAFDRAGLHKWLEEMAVWAASEKKEIGFLPEETLENLAAYHGEGYLIIDISQVVIPKPIQVVTKYEL